MDNSHVIVFVPVVLLLLLLLVASHISFSANPVLNAGPVQRLPEGYVSSITGYTVLEDYENLTETDVPATGSSGP